MTQENWDLMPKKLQKAQAKHLVNKFNPKHKINILFVFEFGDSFLVINKDNLVTKVFEDEKEAVNYCLDNYSNSKEVEQIGLFSND